MNLNSATTKSTVPARIASHIREQILDGKIAPGTPLREEALAQEHQISRHVIRETLRILAAEGIAEYSAFKGVRVPYMTVEDVHEVYQSRAFLEESVLRIPNININIKKLSKIHGEYSSAVDSQLWNEAFRLDLEFHAAIVDLGNNKRVEAWHRNLFQALALAHLICPDFREFGLTRSVSEHAEIVVALGAGDIGRAIAILQKHLSESDELLTDRINHEGGIGKERDTPDLL